MSSNVNEVIRAVLDFLFVFLQKDFTRTKRTKKHKKHKKAQRHNQVKEQNANKRTVKV